MTAYLFVSLIRLPLVPQCLPQSLLKNKTVDDKTGDFESSNKPDQYMYHEYGKRNTAYVQCISMYDCAFDPSPAFPVHYKGDLLLICLCVNLCKGFLCSCAMICPV